MSWALSWDKEKADEVENFCFIFMILGVAIRRKSDHNIGEAEAVN